MLTHSVSPYNKSDEKIITGTWLISQTMILIQAWVFIRFCLRWLIGQLTSWATKPFKVNRIQPTISNRSEAEQIDEFTKRMETTQQHDDPPDISNDSTHAVASGSELVEKEALST